MLIDTEALKAKLEGARAFERPLSVPVCVLDTNIILDIFYFKDPKVQTLTQAIEEGKIVPVGHFDTFAELADVISRSQFHLTESEQDDLLDHWVRAHLLILDPLEKKSFCKDPDDDKFFNLACLAKAAYLISKDKKVLKARGKLKTCGCSVILPEKFSA